MASILQEAKAHTAFSSLLARGEQTQILLLEICGCLSARYCFVPDLQASSHPKQEL